MKTSQRWPLGEIIEWQFQWCDPRFYIPSVPVSLHLFGFWEPWHSRSSELNSNNTIAYLTDTPDDSKTTTLSDRVVLDTMQCVIWCLRNCDNDHLKNKMLLSLLTLTYLKLTYQYSLMLFSNFLHINSCHFYFIFFELQIRWWCTVSLEARNRKL